MRNEPGSCAPSDQVATNNEGLTRRDALQVSAAGCAGAVLSSSIDISNSAFPTISQWRSVLGDEFTVLTKSFHEDLPGFRPVKIELVEATEFQNSGQDNEPLPKNVSAAPLSLCFKTVRRSNLESSTYKVRHPKLGTYNLFLKELRPDGDYRFFEVIIG